MAPARRILYVEDNPTNFRIVERLLRDEGYHVIHAQDGFEGVRRAVEERSSLDLILLDINLPGMDGYEAATKLKALPGFDLIPIIAVTVNTLKGDRKRTLAAGCDGYIPKPIDLQTFPGRVEEYIRGRRDRIQAPAEERHYLREHAARLVDRLETSRDQLRLTHEQIQHKDKLASLGEMAAGIAHELRNPLSSISFAVEMLLRKDPGAPPERKHMELIHRNVDRLQALAEGLTSFARPSDSATEDVDVSKTLNDSLLVTQHEFRRRSISLHTPTDYGLPAVWANESMLQHVFVNLLRNAAQAVSSRTEIDAKAPAEIHVGTDSRADGFVGVTIRDTGVGIRPEYQDRLFTPFFTTKPKGHGTGLGLYIVKQILDEIGGRIEVESRLGQGTTFRLLLPKAAGRRRQAS